MTRHSRIVLLAAAMVAVTLSPAAAEELRVLSGAGLAGPVRALAADFGTRHALTVTVTTDTAGGVQKRIETGEKFDLVIGTTQVIEALTSKKLVAPLHFNIARMVEGVAVKAGAPKPDLHDAAAVKAVLLAAHSIAYADPGSGAVSGAFLLEVADKMGIADQVRAKAVLQQTGAAVPEAVAKGDAELGVTLISEMRPNGGVAAWPLPDDIQMTTVYAAALTARPANKNAGILLEELHGPLGRAAVEKSGLVPASQ